MGNIVNVVIFFFVINFAAAKLFLPIGMYRDEAERRDAETVRDILERVSSQITNDKEKQDFEKQAQEVVSNPTTPLVGYAMNNHMKKIAELEERLKKAEEAVLRQKNEAEMYRMKSESCEAELAEDESSPEVMPKVSNEEFFRQLEQVKNDLMRRIVKVESDIAEVKSMTSDVKVITSDVKNITLQTANKLQLTTSTVVRSTNRTIDLGNGTITIGQETGNSNTVTLNSESSFGRMEVDGKLTLEGARVGTRFVQKGNRIFASGPRRPFSDYRGLADTAAKAQAEDFVKDKFETFEDEKQSDSPNRMASWKKYYPRN